MTDAAHDAVTLAAALAELGARGAGRVDPARWHLAEGLARRAPAHAGAARRVIDARLATLVEALAAALARAEAAPARTARVRDANPGPLAALAVRASARSRSSAGASISIAPVEAKPGAPAGRPSRRAATAPLPVAPEPPPGLDYFRRTWSRLKAEERLARSRESLPFNAGPLNSQHLVHRALATLHELSPAYFEHFISHVDDLLWIESATGAAGIESPAPPRAEGERKPRGR